MDMTKEVLEKALAFYADCPDGQYDGEAWMVLREVLAALTEGLGEVRIDGMRLLVVRVY